MHWLYHTIRYFLVHWGYWAVIVGLMAESAGVPIPGETTLMFASFLAHKNTGLHLVWIIVLGTAAAVVGDNLGFYLGYKFGKTFIRWMKKLFHMDDTDIKAAKDLIKRHGGITVFFARFIFGLRTIAGPLAGTLGMEWKRFLLFNVAGAAVWVTAMACTGFAFASQFETLLGYFETASWIIAGGLFALGYFLWRHQKHKFKERQEQKEAA